MICDSDIVLVSVPVAVLVIVADEVEERDAVTDSVPLKDLLVVTELLLDLVSLASGLIVVVSEDELVTVWLSVGNGVCVVVFETVSELVIVDESVDETEDEMLEDIVVAGVSDITFVVLEVTLLLLLVLELGLLVNPLVDDTDGVMVLL